MRKKTANKYRDSEVKEQEDQDAQDEKGKKVDTITTVVTSAPAVLVFPLENSDTGSSDLLPLSFLPGSP